MAEPDHFHFRLYLDRRQTRGTQAEAALLDVCSQRLGDGGFDLDIVDVGNDPEIAEREGIFATPTIVRLMPEPVRRVVGVPTKQDDWAALLGMG